MAEVQLRPHPGLLALVPGHDVGLEPATVRDDLAQGGRVAARDRLGAVLQEREEVGVEDHAVLDHLGQTAAELARRQGREHLGIDPDAHRLVERADDVLARGWLTPDLAADRAIDHRQEGRGDHQQGEAPGVGRGDEAGEVADDAPPERDDRGMAVGAEPDQIVVEVGSAVRATCSARPAAQPRASR